MLPIPCNQNVNAFMINVNSFWDLISVDIVFIKPATSIRHPHLQNHLILWGPFQGSRKRGPFWAILWPSLTPPANPAKFFEPPTHQNTFIMYNFSHLKRNSVSTIVCLRLRFVREHLTFPVVSVYFKSNGWVHETNIVSWVSVGVSGRVVESGKGQKLSQDHNSYHFSVNDQQAH